MTSIFTRFVAQGVELPAEIAQLEACEVVTADQGQAATVAQTITSAPDFQISRAMIEENNAVDGTQSPK